MVVQHAEAAALSGRSAQHRRMDDIDDSDEGEDAPAASNHNHKPCVVARPRSRAEHAADLQSMKTRLMGRLARNSARNSATAAAERIERDKQRQAKEALLQQQQQKQQAALEQQRVEERQRDELARMQQRIAAQDAERKAALAQPARDSLSVRKARVAFASCWPHVCHVSRDRVRLPAPPSGVYPDCALRSCNAPRGDTGSKRSGRGKRDVGQRRVDMRATARWS